METMYLYAIAAVVLSLVIIVPALLEDRSPIPETSNNVYKITKTAELDAILKSTTNVVVDFYADWCPPCRTIAPVFSNLAEEHYSKGQLAFVKVNVDNVKDTAERFKVTAMPSFLVFRNGEQKGVAVEGMKDRRTVTLTEDGLVSRILGADKVALEAVVQALSGKKGGASVQESSGKDEKE